MKAWPPSLLLAPLALLLLLAALLLLLPLQAAEGCRELNGSALHNSFACLDQLPKL